MVWFKKIQEDENSQYILLLDEPGLNLHASAQSDLLRFIEDLSDNYQVIYTTHSPFMVESNKLERIRTVRETKIGTEISDSVQEKDPRTLFPLQVALGYDIAQNLFISKKNLLVEGISDLIYLEYFSELLESNNREYLNSDITIVPVGGLDKVATFISLLRGSKLNIVCLLDSSIDTKNRAKLSNIIEREKLIEKSKVLYFNSFINGSKEADIEDLFRKEEYLILFNKSFSNLPDISSTDLNNNIDRIILQINKKINTDRFNHFKPAKQLLKESYDIKDFNKTTLNNFEKVFKKVNTLFVGK